MPRIEEDIKVPQLAETIIYKARVPNIFEILAHTPFLEKDQDNDDDKIT